MSAFSAGSVLAGRGRSAIEKTRGLRGGLARLLDTLPDAAPRVRADADAATVAQQLTRVEDWVEIHRPRFDRAPIRALRRQYETAVWP